MGYTVDNPPKNWKSYPKSFLHAAIPILNDYYVDDADTRETAFSKVWHKLAELGITGLLKSNGCPEIIKFSAVKEKSMVVSYSYDIKANLNLDYFISISAFDKNNHFLTVNISPDLTGAGIIKSEKGEIGSIKLTVRPVGVDGVIDSKVISFKLEQPSLF